MFRETRWIIKAATGYRAIALVAAIALPAAAASAQTAPTKPVFYKGKGVGGDNSYFNRYEEDFSFLRDPSKSTDFFDPLKFIAFDDAKQIYVTFSALERLRYDNIQNNTYNLGSQVKAHQAEAYERRTQVGADLHLGPNFRVYAELLNAAASGRNLNGVGRVGGTGAATSWRNDLALQQGFIEAMTSLEMFGEPRTIGIRAGRQGIYLGNGLAFSFNPRLPRPTRCQACGRGQRWPPPPCPPPPWPPKPPCPAKPWPKPAWATWPWSPWP
jgi:hypothetical protein